ncbi:MAG TPA: helix-turn-helix domain-containing protein [Thermomicrobiales bacterium]|nr:helix-turn-helix domain-containing protein [Thermomicrobiales bacterium]
MIAAEREPAAASVREQAQLQELQEFYRDRELRASGPTTLISPSGRAYELPETVVRLLAEVVNALARGEAVSVVPVQQELTTQEAADLLNVSRQYLVRLLDRGDIPCHKVGTHRRISLGDLMDYKRSRDRARHQGFDELAQLSQELGLYDE